MKARTDLGADPVPDLLAHPGPLPGADPEADTAALPEMSEVFV